MKKINIAIDGPSGAGKSTLSKKLADELDFLYIDTGALYRMIGLFAFESGLTLENAAGAVSLLNKIKLGMTNENGEKKFFLNGEDVTEKIRKNEISMYASKVSAVPEVREFLLDTQRDFARENNCIMDGRDIGTVILPNADIKIFLTASAEERARRRYDELVQKGEKIEYQKVLDDVRQRDYNDENRAIAPLKPAADSILLDTTGCSFEQAFELLKKTVKEKL